MNRQDAKSAKSAKMREPGEEVDRLAYAVNGAAIEVHRVLGPGFRESTYEEALCVELALRGIPFARQVTVTLDYQGHTVGEGRLDLLIGGALIVELKAVDKLDDIHTAQVISYLKATGHRLGLLLNFNVPALKDGMKRVVVS